MIQTDVPGSFCSAHDENWGGGGGGAGGRGGGTGRGRGRGGGHCLVAKSSPTLCDPMD